MHRASATTGRFSGVLANTTSTKATAQQGSATTTRTVAESETELISQPKVLETRVDSSPKSSDASAADDKTDGEDRLAHQTLKALAAISNGTTAHKGISSNPVAKPVNHNRGVSGSGWVINKPLDNPFLDQRPRKLPKSTHNTTFSILQTQPKDTSAGNSRQTGRESSKITASKKPQSSLILTRVLAANSPSKNLSRNNKPLVSAVTSATITSRVNGSTINTSTAKDDQSFSIPTSRQNITDQHPSTTPKQPPKSDYYQFLARANAPRESSPNVSSTEKAYDSQLFKTSISSGAMDFARKSIMQHATASPKTAIRKINKVTADNNGKPSLIDLLTASDAEDNADPQSYSSKGFPRESFTEPNTPFTFESTPLPSLDINAPQRSTAAFESNALNTLQPTEDQRTESNPSNGPDPVVSGAENKAQARREALDPQEVHATEPRAFDLRTALQEDLNRSRSSNAFLPRASIAHRAVPYKPPTVNERETLRASRMPGFRARPLDPRVFTSAGDLGVPRVKKQPLTIPVSPVFSKPRVKSSAISESEPVKTTALSRLANFIKNKPDRRPATRPHAKGESNMGAGNRAISEGTATTNDSIVTRSVLLSVPTVDQTRSIPSDSESASQKPAASNATKADVHPSNPASRPVEMRLFSGLGARKGIQGPPIRWDGSTSAATSGQSSNNQAGASAGTNRSQGTSLMRRPLTQPIPFRFATDDILRRRHVMFTPKKTAETTPTTTSLKEATNGGSSLNKITKVVRHPQPPREREQRMKLRESLERTFRARPIKHYNPITIHRATKPLTKPVSPMIGEKRKRHEMELQYLQQEREREIAEHSMQFNEYLGNQQQHDNNRLSLIQHTSGASDSHLADLGSSADQEIYRQFEEGKILQEEHQALQKQLTRQERRQLELANSTRATIHQPPIRLSFPLDPELENLQDSNPKEHKDANDDDNNQQPNVIPPLPPVRDSFGGSNSHHLSRELRRISLEASRGSSGGGYRKRLSDINSRSSGSGGDNRGSTSGRSSLEGGTGSVGGGYFPFSRSQAPTISNTNEPSLLSQPRAAEQESENRRRSGSFIPLEKTEPTKTSSSSRTSRLSSGLFGTTHSSLGMSSFNNNVGGSLSRSKGPVVIDQTLTLSDL
ncbi:hypothetical protein BGX27_009483 [Mortierella sp. AM989]|nr:hypothetical protein BGX27_009483 [Mortierella sp. AM989]